MAPLGNLFDDAFVFASIAHRLQTRKETNVPYIAHLMSVAALALEYGADEEQAAAALLHDAPEDQGGAETLAEIRARFGDRVADLVADCSEPPQLKGMPWWERKRAHVAHLARVESDSLLIVACDKLHNIRSIVAEIPDVGNAVFDRFGGGLDGSLWYYATLAETLGPRVPSSLARELRRAVDEMTALANQPT